MHPALKLLLALLALPVLLFGGAFLYGGYLGVTGQLEEPEPSGVSSEDQGSSSEPQAPAARALAPLPAPLDARGAGDWLTGQRLLWTEGDDVRGNAEAFTSLPVEDAVALHRALREGGSEFDGLRILTFAWCSHLPPESRLAFANEVGIAFRPDGEHWGRSYIGELTGLFFYQTQDADSIYAQAVRSYCEVVGDDEVIRALRDFGVIQEDPSIGQWFTRVDEKMQGFDPDTLLAIRDAIDLSYGLGDRKYLRASLADFAESKRDA